MSTNTVKAKTTAYRGWFAACRHFVGVDVVSVGVAATPVQLGRASHLARYHLQDIYDRLETSHVRLPPSLLCHL